MPYGVFETLEQRWDGRESKQKAETMSESRTRPAARVVVGVSGSPGSLTALRRAADEARRRGAELWPVLAWQPPEGHLADRRVPAPGLLLGECKRQAAEQLLAALCDVFGGAGPKLPGRVLLVEGAPGPALVQTADRAGDILVVGAGGRGLWRRVLWPSVGRYCLAHADCPVLAVPPSPLEAALAEAHRRNILGLRLDTGDLLKETGAVPPDA